MIINNCLKQSGSGINYLYDFTCCGYVLCEIKLAPGEASKVVNKIEWFDACGGVILEVNGIPYANPLTIPMALVAGDDDSKIIVKIEICNCEPVGGTFTTTLVVHEQGGGGATTFTFDFQSISSVNFPINTSPITWFPCVDDCNELQGEVILIDNPSPLYYILRPDHDCTFGDPTAVVKWYLNGDEIDPNDAYLPPNSYGNELTWTICNQSSPWISCQFSYCTANIDICATIYPVDVTINPVVCGDCGLNCCDIVLETDNGYLQGVKGLCTIASGQVYDTAAIGEKKSIRIKYHYDYGFTGDDIDIYFNPWLYDVTCNFGSKYAGGLINQPMPNGWYIQFQMAMMGAGQYNMTLYGAGVNANCQKNIQLYITFIDTYTFEIQFDFYMIEDIDDWVSSVVIPNNPKLLQSHISAPNQLQNLVQSVYNAVKSICMMIYMVDPNNQVEIPNTGDPFANPPVPNDTEPYECYLIKNIPYSARFYNQGLLAGPSEFTNHSFSFSRASISVPNFSTLLKTEITFQVDNPSGSGIDSVVFWLIDASQFNDFDTFWNNYDSSRSGITTIPGFSILDNHLQSPSLGPTLVAGNTYECKAYVGTSVNASSQYYIIAVAYSFVDNMVNSFIHGPVSVTSIPGIEICCPLDFDSKWFDYHNLIGLYCFAPTMKERILNIQKITAGAFENCLKDYGWLPGFPDWNTFLSKIKLNVYRRVDNFPSAGQITWFMFNQYQSTRQVGFPGNWNNPNPSFQVSETGTIVDLVYETRIRYEDNLPISGSSVFVSNASTPFNRTPAGALGSVYASTNNITFDWGGQTIWFEFIYELDLTSFFGQTCIVNMISMHQSKIIDFEPNTAPFTSWLNPPTLYGIKGSNPPVLLASSIICTDQYDQLLVDITSNGTLPVMDGFLIGLIDKSPFGIGNLGEDDGSVASITGLSQLDVPAITFVSPTFLNTGQIVIDLNQLNPGNYQICGLFIDNPATLTP